MEPPSLMQGTPSSFIFIYYATIQLQRFLANLRAMCHGNFYETQFIIYMKLGMQMWEIRRN